MEEGGQLGVDREERGDGPGALPAHHTAQQLGDGVLQAQNPAVRALVLVVEAQRPHVSLRKAKQAGVGLGPPLLLLSETPDLFLLLPGVGLRAPARLEEAHRDRSGLFP